MKKYSLKPLGDSCIHVLCKSAFLIGLLMTFSLAACSDDDDDTVTPIFPEKQNIICNAGDTREFTFTANTNWSLASSAIWCKFKADDMEEFTLSGAAGSHTVTLMVTDDNQKVNNISVAKLELTMGGQTIVIGEITRSKVKYELTIYDADGNEVDEETGALVVGYKKYAKFSVKANFRFAATNLPGWVELEGGSMVGAVNQEVSGGLQIIENESREKYPVDPSNNNVITFSDEEGRAFRSIKVSYAGMPADILDLTRPSSYPTDWVVSMDGKTFTQKSSGGSTGDVTIAKRMPFTIKTLNDDYVFVYMEEWEGDIYLIDPEMLWIHCEGDKGKINLTVDAYEPFVGFQPEERTGYVLAFSRAEYESIKDNLEGKIVENGEIAYRYEQNNLLISFTQKEIKSSGGDEVLFTAVDGTTQNPIECTSYTGDNATSLKTKYGVSSIAEIKQPSAGATTVTTLFSITNFECFYLDDDQSALITEQYTDTQIEIDAKKSDGRDVYVIFTDDSGIKQMLIVRISNAGSGDEEQKFVVMNGSTPIIYEGANAEELIGMHNLVGIYQTQPMGESIDIEMTPSAIQSFKVFDLDNGNGSIDITGDVSDGCAWGYNDWGLEQIGKINAWFGGGSPLENKTILIVVTCENGEVYGIVASAN